MPMVGQRPTPLHNTPKIHKGQIFGESGIMGIGTFSQITSRRMPIVQGIYTYIVTYKGKGSGKKVKTRLKLKF